MHPALLRAAEGGHGRVRRHGPGHGSPRGRELQPGAARRSPCSCRHSSCLPSPGEPGAGSRAVPAAPRPGFLPEPAALPWLPARPLAVRGLGAVQELVMQTGCHGFNGCRFLRAGARTPRARLPAPRRRARTRSQPGSAPGCESAPGTKGAVLVVPGPRAHF